MASALYPPFKQSLLSQNPSVDLDTDTIKVALVNVSTDYTYSAAHQYKSSVTSYSGTTDQTLTSPTVALGVFDAADSTFTSVAISGAKTVQALVVYKDTGSAATSPLIAYIDGFTAITPNGGNITVTWDNGAAKIFAL
ncbi:putative RNA methylase [Pseudarthrobacter sp. W1I19]|nr:putative RNA methylase [Pseudarthrobacter sp. W1I19]